MASHAAIKPIVTEYYVRHHQYLVVARIVDDPVYLTEPFIRSYNWVLNENIHLAPNYCIPSELVSRPAGWVPHHLPGTNRYLTEFASRWRVPVEATRGGAESMYPEYQLKLAAMPEPPAYAEYKESLGKEFLFARASRHEITNDYEQVACWHLSGTAPALFFDGSNGPRFRTGGGPRPTIAEQRSAKSKRQRERPRTARSGKGLHARRRRCEHHGAGGRRKFVRSRHRISTGQ